MCVVFLNIIADRRGQCERWQTGRAIRPILSKQWHGKDLGRSFRRMHRLKVDWSLWTRLGTGWMHIRCTYPSWRRSTNFLYLIVFEFVLLVLIIDHFHDSVSERISINFLLEKIEWKNTGLMALQTFIISNVPFADIQWFLRHGNQSRYCWNFIWITQTAILEFTRSIFPHSSFSSSIKVSEISVIFSVTSCSKDFVSSNCHQWGFGLSLWSFWSALLLFR